MPALSKILAQIPQMHNSIYQVLRRMISGVQNEMFLAARAAQSEMSIREDKKQIGCLLFLPIRVRTNVARLPIIFMLIACASYGPVWGLSTDEALPLVGKWSALSKSHLSINGEMEIFQDRISWEKHGPIRYRVLEQKDDALFVELEKEVDCGRYLRLGPLSKGDLEVAFYETQERLQMPKRPKSFKKDELEYDPGCSWGVYVKLFE